MNAMWENLFRANDAGSETRDLLKKIYIFQDLGKKELALLEDMVHIRLYNPGEPVFRQGELGVGVYMLKSGSVEINVENVESASGEVNIAKVTSLGPGDFFGEMSLVEENSRRGASAIALEESVLIGFFKPDLMEIIERNPSMGAKILLRLSETLGKRLSITASKVTDLKRKLKSQGDTDE